MVSKKQYPFSREGKKGLQPVIESLLKAGLLEPCMSPYNTPILPVKKPDGTYRMVQELRIINKIVKPRHPTVLDPYTILNQILSSHQYYSVLDLKDAFWGCPITEDRKQYFAFEWEQEEGGKMIKQQLTWTVLPQGYTEPPVLFGQALQKMLREFTPPSGVKLLQYVDDLLLSGEQE